MGAKRMKQLYKPIRFRADTLRLIDTLNDIVEDYLAQGYVLTVRQLYYQMVARGHIENAKVSGAGTASAGLPG